MSPKITNYYAIMPERDNNVEITSEQISQEILLFVQEAQFGTAQYLAINDELDRDEIHHSIIKSKENPNMELEFEYALITERIKQGESRIYGYSRALRRFQDLQEDLSSTLADEAHERYQSDEDIISYMDNIYNPTMNKAKEIILEKRK